MLALGRGHAGAVRSDDCRWPCDVFLDQLPVSKVGGFCRSLTQARSASVGKYEIVARSPTESAPLSLMWNVMRSIASIVKHEIVHKSAVTSSSISSRVLYTLQYSGDAVDAVDAVQVVNTLLLKLRYDGGSRCDVHT